MPHRDDWSPFPSTQTPIRKKGERAWTLSKGSETLTAGYLDRSPHGWEVQIYHGKNFVLGQLFPSRQQAESFAEERKQEFTAQGWAVVSFSDHP